MIAWKGNRCLRSRDADFSCVSFRHQPLWLIISPFRLSYVQLLEEFEPMLSNTGTFAMHDSVLCRESFMLSAGGSTCQRGGVSTNMQLYINPLQRSPKRVNLRCYQAPQDIHSGRNRESTQQGCLSASWPPSHSLGLREHLRQQRWQHCDSNFGHSTSCEHYCWKWWTFLQSEMRQYPLCRVL